MRKQRGICVEIDGIFYESMSLAVKQLRCGKLKLKDRCLSDKFPNWRIVPFRVTYTEKECFVCGNIKPLNEFYVCKRNKDKLTSKCKQCVLDYQCNNPEIGIKASIKWKKNNPEKVRANYNEWERERMKNDPGYRLNKNMATDIRNSLRGEKNGAHWEGLVGYTCEELMMHLEKQFLPGMTWRNYGRNGWHVDHIIAIYWWNITSVKCKAFKMCWSLENLRPMWGADNIKKGNTLFY